MKKLTVRPFWGRSVTPKGPNDHHRNGKAIRLVFEADHPRQAGP